MHPSSHPKRASFTGLFVVALIFALLAGAVLVRLVDTDSSPSTIWGADKDTDVTAQDSLNSQELPREGRVAPDFTLVDLEGNTVSLSDWRGRTVLINFWATWCGPCEVEMPTIQAAYEARREDGFVVLAVAVDDTAKNVRRFFDKQGLTFQPLMDDGTVSLAYQVFGLPTSFFVGSNGQISAVHTGVLTERKINEYLARISTK